MKRDALSPSVAAVLARVERDGNAWATVVNGHPARMQTISACIRRGLIILADPSRDHGPRFQLSALGRGLLREYTTEQTRS